MRLSLSLSEILLAAVVVGGIGIAAWQLLGDRAGAPSRRVEVPDLSATASAGRLAFDANCAMCHGKNAGGTEQGPPLVHDIYNPGHHSDVSFQYAVRRGVQQHHWHFGNMPPLPQVSDEQIGQIVRYVRELQQANGIVRRRHQM
jgi:mono/diheme cytochrome c family protein